MAVGSDAVTRDEPAVGGTVGAVDWVGVSDKFSGFDDASVGVALEGGGALASVGSDDCGASDSGHVDSLPGSAFGEGCAGVVDSGDSGFAGSGFAASGVLDFVTGTGVADWPDPGGG